MKHKIPLFCYMILMWIVSSIPGNNNPLPFPGFDKIVHIIEYSIFGLLFLRYLYPQFQKYAHNKVLILYFVFSFVWAASDELHQYFVPLRSMDVVDLFADMFGVVLALFVFKKICRKSL
ncbi:MAG: VanZ family protein [Candidatus Omnitrophica bacterium]|nr:VanZ family protein [Candidatus Omnitrophota bacterium]